MLRNPTACMFCYAAGAGDLFKVQSLVSTIDVNCLGTNGETSTYKACKAGHVDVVQFLASNGADLNIANSQGWFPINIAAENRHMEALQVLAANGANFGNINCLGPNGETSTYKACKAGHADVVQFLASNGADLNIANSQGWFPINIAAENRHMEALQVLAANGANFGNINCLGPNGETSTYKACKAGHADVVQFLASKGADLNIANSQGWFPINVAAENGHIKVLQVLAAHGAHLDKPLLMSKKNLDAVVALLNLGADVSIKDSDGKTCLDQFSAKDKLKVLTMVQLNLSLLEGHNCALWFVIVQVADTTDAVLFAKLSAMVEALVSSHPTLAAAKDADGRAAVDVASKPMKSIMQSVLLWHGRYRITEPRPEHISATCFVFKAVDEYTIDSETIQPIKVALKLMRLKDQFQREISTRDKEFNNQMVMNVLQQVRPNSLHKATSQFNNDDVYHLSQVGVYSKSCYRCVESALVETVYRLRSEDPTKTMPLYRCSKHVHDLSLNPIDNKRKCDVCGADSSRYTCTPCNFDICETCFNKVDDHQEFRVESTTWLFTIQDGKDQPEIELARSDVPTARVSDAVFSTIKVSEGENGTVIVTNIQSAMTVSPDVTPVNEPNEVLDVEADATGQLSKTNAEKLFLLVMPLADRNLFVALKQERWAGKNMEEVRHVFVQLVHCVEHMHEKGVLHADLKTLNIVRTAGQWKLIDLDAACEIGKEPVGHKSSSAYVPPEAIYIDEKTDTACVRSVVTLTNGEAIHDLLMAHPSFDVWSLGCILYQMCTPDVKPLFQGGQDDNLVGVRKGVDNLFALAEWSNELKADKLADVPDKLARNLLSQMLHKDPLQRPSLSRVLAHSFLSGKKVARLIGEKPKYDVFLSYRVAADALHVEKLYDLLTAQGFIVYWDKLCLEPGVDWEQGFCEGLVSSRAFVPLLSRDAINHPDKAWQNFSKLAADSSCDNVFLEHRLAVELQGLGLIEKMFPVFIGNLDATTSEYSNYFGSGCNPTLSEVTVKSVEEKLRHHMESQALGTPIVPDRTVKSVVDAITACQGAFIVGPADATFADAAASITKMLTDVPITQSPRAGSHVHQALLRPWTSRHW